MANNNETEDILNDFYGDGAQEDPAKTKGEPPVPTPEPTPTPTPEPPTPTPEPPANPAPTVDDFSWLPTVFGDEVKRVDDLKNLNYKELKAKATEYETKQQELEQIRNNFQNPFANDTIYKINELSKKINTTDLGMLTKIASSDIDKLDAKEAIKIKMILDRPELAGDQERLNRYIDKQYNLVNLDDMDDEEKADALFELEMKSGDARKTLKELQSSVNEYKPDAQVQERMRAAEQIKEAWSPVIKKAVESFDKLSIVNEKGEPLFDYAIPKEDAVKYETDLLAFAQQNNIPIDQKSIAVVKEYFDNIYLLSNKDKVFAAMEKSIRAKAEEDYLKKMHNPSNPAAGDKHSHIPDDDTADKLIDFITS